MTEKEFDKTGFYPGLKVKVIETGEIHDLIGAEFDNRLVEIKVQDGDDWESDWFHCTEVEILGLVDKNQTSIEFESAQKEKSDEN